MAKKYKLLKSKKSYRNLRDRDTSKKNKLIASKFSKEYFDGTRSQGYGGYYYDGRWVKIAKKLIKKFKLKKGSKVLDVGCAKGFLMHDLKKVSKNKIEVYGIDVSKYAKSRAMSSVRSKINIMNCKKLNFKDNSFDLVIAINVVHNLSSNLCKKSIKEIQRVSGGKAFIQVDAYRNDNELKILKKWIVTAKTYMKPAEWKQMFKETGYSGFYDYTILEDDKWLIK
jgi:ubiquinone/menaquinone biosynthesis C-methylase UbiE